MIESVFVKVTFQARIFTTALFARVILKQELSLRRWLAIALLMIGVILAQVCLFSPNVNFKSS